MHILVLDLCTSLANTAAISPSDTEWCHLVTQGTGVVKGTDTEMGIFLGAP